MTSLTAAQCREARGLLRWSRDRLAARAGITVAILVRIEREKAKLLSLDIAALRTASEEGGVEFTLEGDGILVARARLVSVEIGR